MTRGAASQIDPPVSKKGPAGSLKAEVYSSVRNALRFVKRCSVQIFVDIWDYGPLEKLQVCGPQR